jgi:hypothetical protein
VTGLDSPLAHCPGDTNADRDVDFGDITTILSRFGYTYTFPYGPGDSDGSHTVDFIDITTTLANWQLPCN